MRTIEVGPVGGFAPTTEVRASTAGRQEAVESEPTHRSRLRSVLRWRRRGGDLDARAPEVVTPRRESPFPFC